MKCLDTVESIGIRKSLSLTKDVCDMSKRFFIIFIMVISIMITLTGCDFTSEHTESEPERSNDMESTTTPARDFAEQEVIINPGQWQLPGTLCLPGDGDIFPVVIFVHGSGPVDRDETIGKHKPFKDLAHDLAKLGVASIRYDKRTYVYTDKVASDTALTVKEETIDDVIHAVAFARALPSIDKQKIFVLGHSMGGYLIPRIYEADTESHIKGYISLAGSARSIMVLLLEQIDYFLSLDPTLKDEDKATYKNEYIDIDTRIKELSESDKGSSELILGAYPSYWLDLADYKPAELITDVDKPILFLQGGHDYNVTTTDFEMWRTALQGRGNAEFILYPDLTHSFAKTQAKGTPDDYNTYAQVDKTVSKDISNFITNTSK